MSSAYNEKRPGRARRIILRTLLIVGIVLFSIIFLILFAVFVTPVFERVSPEKLDRSDCWMKDISDGSLLSEISIPGTHDSATYSVDLSFFMKCQALDFRGQLDAGFRYLDIRLRISRGELVFCHAFADCKSSYSSFASVLSLDDALEDIYSFLDDNPSETVLFVVKSEGDDDIAEFQRILDSTISEDPDKWLLVDSIPSLGDCRGKAVLFRRYGDEAGFGARAGIDLNWSDQGSYCDPSSSLVDHDKNGFVLSVQDRYRFSESDKLIALDSSLSKAAERLGGTYVTINFLSTVGEAGVSHPKWVADHVNSRFRKSGFGERPGWVIFDYGDASLARSVYSHN